MVAPKPWTSVRYRLFLLVAITLGPVTGLVLSDAVQERERQSTDLQERNKSSLAILEADQQQWIETTRQLLQTVARLTDILEPDRCTAVVRDLHTSYRLYANLGLAAGDGTITCSALAVDGPANAGNRSWFLRAVSTGRFSAGDYQTGTITHRATINFGYPVRDASGVVAGVVFAAVDLFWLNDRLAQADLPAGEVLMLLDSQAGVLARFPEDPELIGKPIPDESLAQAIRGDRRGSLETRRLDGVNRLYSFAPLDEDATVFVAVGVPTEAAYAAINQTFVRNLVTLGLVAAVALIAASWVGSRSVVRRADQLVATTKRISEGNLDARSGVPHDEGEFGQIAQAIDEMAASLQRLVAKEHLLDRLQKKEAELGQLLVQIMKLNRELHQRNEELDEFAHAVSHDLKAPLRAISNLAQWIDEEESAKMAPQSRENLARIRNRVSRLGAMIDGVLAYARAMRSDEHAEPVRVHRLLREVVELVSPPAGMQVEIQPGALEIVTPPVRLHQVFQNLIGNAVKYHGDAAHGHIRIGWTEKAKEVEFWVSDDGPGIPTEAQERIFKLFETLHADKTKEGTGIGLAIVKRIVEAEGGTVRVESEPGKGSTFRFTWPKAPAPPLVAPMTKFS